MRVKDEVKYQRSKANRAAIEVFHEVDAADGRVAARKRERVK